MKLWHCLMWSFSRNGSGFMQSFTWFEAALFVKGTICMLLQSCRNFVEKEMSSYGFRMDLEFTTFKFLLVKFFWIEKLQRHSVFTGLCSGIVDFILKLLLFAR